MKNLLPYLAFVSMLMLSTLAFTSCESTWTPEQRQHVETIDAAIDAEDDGIEETEDAMKTAVSVAEDKFKEGDTDGAAAAVAEFDALVGEWKLMLERQNDLIAERNAYVEETAMATAGPLIETAGAINPLYGILGTIGVGLASRFAAKKSAGQMKKALVNTAKLQLPTALDHLKKALGYKHTNQTPAELLKAAKLVAFREGDTATVAKIESLEQPNTL